MTWALYWHLVALASRVQIMKVRGVNMVAREELNNSRPGLTFGVIYPPPIPGPGPGQHTSHFRNRAAAAAADTVTHAVNSRFEH